MSSLAIKDGHWTLFNDQIFHNLQKKNNTSDIYFFFNYTAVSQAHIVIGDAEQLRGFMYVD